MTRFALACALTLWLGAFVGSVALASDLEPVGIVLPERLEASPEGGVPGLSLSRPGASFLKVHLAALVLGPGDSLLVTDAQGREVLSLEGPAEGPRWLPSVEGEALYLRVLPGNAGSQWSLKVDAVGEGFSSPGGRDESVCGADDRRDAACYGSDLRTPADAVGRMRFADGSYIYVCTGSLVSSEGHFLTNNHCISNQESADSLDVLWRYQRTTCGGSATSWAGTASGAYLLATDATLDFSLLQFKSENPAALYGHLDLDPSPPVRGREIWIPQHPGGAPKEFAVESDMDAGPARVVSESVRGNAPGTDFGYYADTEGGSSGSPVLGADHRMVGLHHFGTGGVACTATTMNQGVKMSLIHPYLAPFLTACQGGRPAVTSAKYVGAYRKMKVYGSGFTQGCQVLVDGVVLTTKFKNSGFLVGKKVRKIRRGETAQIRVYDPASGCLSEPFLYTRP